MKKVMFISGIITALLLVLLLAGFSGTDDAAKKAMQQGNLKYESSLYEEALEIYESGLNASPDDNALSFNAAQAAYSLGAFDKAMEYYEKSGDIVEKYLNTGNIYFLLGNSLEENEQKLQCYLQALKFYYDGIVLFPQNVPLKYNYETVKAIADDLLSNMEQENSDQSDDSDDSDSDESQEQDGQSQDESTDEQDQGGSDDEQNEDETSGEQAQQDESQDTGEDESSAQQQAEGQDGEQSEAQEGKQDEDQDGEQDASSQYDAAGELDQEVIERILRMLEIQEQESLKNNQEVVGGKDGKYSW